MPVLPHRLRPVGGGTLSRGARRGALALVASLALLGSGSAHADGPGLQSCPADPADKDPMTSPDKVITGQFSSDLMGSYVLLPFDVPAGTSAVRVRYCYDQPENIASLPAQPPGVPLPQHVLDLGLYQARSGPDDLWDSDEFRGWGGSSHPDVTVAPNGFSSEADYLEHPKTHVYGKTTRGFEPGRIPAGKWAVELGAGAIASKAEGDADGHVAWRVEIDLIKDPGYTNDPYRPAPYDTTPANPNPGWYAGDLHVHSEHSNLGAAPMSETFNYAFNPIAPGPNGGAGLDFITLTDYVTDSAWGEIGRYQPAHPGKLIIPSSEVITYRGHTNNQGSGRWADYRTGPIYERANDGTLSLLRPATPPSRIFDTVHAGGGWTQINHPTIFPSQVPGFAFFCRGCPWDYTDAETDYSKVDAIEVATGPAGLKTAPYPGPNPFTPLAIQFYDHALATGAHIAAVGSSDSHTAGQDAGNVSDVTGAPIGMATTVVMARELSKQGIIDGVRAGHTYAKLWGNDGPDVRFCAGALGVDGRCSLKPDPAETVMGDTTSGPTTLTARVTGAGPAAVRPGLYLLVVFKNGIPTLEVPVPTGDYSFRFPSFGSGRYRLQVMRIVSGAASIEDVSSPIYLR